MMKKDSKNKFQEGALYLCATPIGNMEDITLRVLHCLQEADLVAAENPSRSRKLLNHFGIKKPMLSYREENREKVGREIIERLKSGQVIALVTDAGMPAISDPGQNLLRLLLDENLPFYVLPGPSAAMAALLLSGYPARKFVFWGFLSRKKSYRRKELYQLSHEKRTVIIYESPHRLHKTLQDMADILGSRELAVCRELTKLHEEVIRDTAFELLEYYQNASLRGEITLVISPLENAGLENKEKPLEQEQEEREKAKELLRKALEEGMPPTKAVKIAARESTLTRGEVYDIYLSQGNKDLDNEDS